MYPYKRRTIPYKILYYLLYGSKTWLRRPEPYQVEVDTGPFVRALRISNSRLYEGLDYLQAAGIIKSIERSKRGICLINYNPPLGPDSDQDNK